MISALSGRHLVAISWLAMSFTIAILAYGTINSDSSNPDAEWTRQMINHHRQAVEISLISLNNGVDSNVQTVATDILLTQLTQIGRLEQHLIEANKSLFAKSSHLMVGGVSPSQMSIFRKAAGSNSDKMYLSLMIAHHRGAIVMSEQLLKSSHGKFSGSLALSIIDTQAAEIKALENLLATLP
jgi:uncharacterized protein (DUF305 family)